MANIYTKSTTGSDANSGATWALAKATLAGAAGIDAAGDTIWLSSLHNESSLASQTVALAGTTANPTRIMSVADGVEPPTTYTAGAVVGTGAGAYGITITGSGYIAGVQFNVAVGASSAASLALSSGAGAYQRYDNCGFRLGTTSASGRIALASSSSAGGATVEWNNCTVRFANASQGIQPNYTRFRWNGGQIDPASSVPAYLFIFGSAVLADVEVRDVDLSRVSAGGVLVNASTAAGRVVFRNCKLPAGWSGGLVSGVGSIRVSLYNCDAGATNYQMTIWDGNGTINADTSVYRTNGATDGVTPLSWQINNIGATDVNGSNPIYTDEILIWNDAVGSQKTVTVELITDSTVDLTDRDVFVAVGYLGSSAAPVGTQLSSRVTNPLGTGAAHPASSASWVQAMTNPHPQKIQATITPQMAGWISVRVGLAIAQLPVYVCPKLTVS